MIDIISVIYTDNEPLRPENTDYGITIQFDRGSSDPVRIFNAMTEALSGFKRIDRLVLGAIDPDYQPITVLEDVEAASITSWVRNKLAAVDDVAIKEFDPKQQIGKYAVKAKYRIIEYLDRKVAEDEAARLRNLQDDLHKLAQENASSNPLTIPQRVPLPELAGAMDKIQQAKQLLGPQDTISVTAGDESRKLDTSVTKKPSKYVDETTSEHSGEMPMMLAIRKPDLLGDTQWEFKHGATPISAKILDEEWLSSLRSGAVSIASGSIMKCMVHYDHDYDENGHLISVKYEVVRVDGIITRSGGIQETLTLG